MLSFIFLAMNGIYTKTTKFCHKLGSLIDYLESNLLQPFSGLPIVCVYSTHCTKYLLFSIKIFISGHYIFDLMCNLVHGRAPAFIYNFKYGFLSSYWPCSVWSFMDINLPQKVSQISSPLFQQINIYHPMLMLSTQSIFTWRPSFILCEFFEFIFETLFSCRN